MDKAHSESQPLVSCLCITDGRAACLEHAIRCYQEQSYQNKEMLIVYNPADTLSKRVLDKNQPEDIRLVAVERTQGLMLGDLRNIAVEQANGVYVCTWDDDDWYHVDRIARQLESLLRSTKSASILSRILIFDKTDTSLYLATERLWENTLFFNKYEAQKHGIQYPKADRGEDCFFVNELIKANLVYPLLEPRLYMYFVNGMNVCGRAHFERFFEDSQKLSDVWSDVASKAIEHQLSTLQASRAFDAQVFLSDLKLVEYVESRH